MFFVPALKVNFTIGVGPVMVLPTATDSRLSSGQWSVRPTGALIFTKEKVVAGGLINNV